MIATGGAYGGSYSTFGYYPVFEIAREMIAVGGGGGSLSASGIRMADDYTRREPFEMDKLYALMVLKKSEGELIKRLMLVQGGEWEKTMRLVAMQYSDSETTLGLTLYGNAEWDISGNLTLATSVIGVGEMDVELEKYEVVMV